MLWKTDLEGQPLGYLTEKTMKTGKLIPQETTRIIQGLIAFIDQILACYNLHRSAGNKFKSQKWHLPPILMPLILVFCSRFYIIEFKR